MHHIYHTEGIILSSHERGEANKMLSIFTREMGMIRAAAQGIRHGKSKLRYALADYSHARVDLVRGRDVWRVTSAQPLKSFASLVLDGERGKIAQNIIQLILRLYHGEEENIELYDHLLTSLETLAGTTLSGADLKHFEMVVVFRILYHLGYLALTGENDVFVRSPIDVRLIEEAAKVRVQMLSDIHRSLEESQL